jgi:50S ribosomal protein L16 3-hydroxylase
MKKNHKVSKKTETPLALLGGISAAEFLAKYWHKKPLLIRGAIADFDGLLSPDELAGFACEEDVQSRVVSFSKNKWQLADGPFDEKYFQMLPRKDWALLVQTLNHHLPEAAALLKQFNFIPHARLDDLMVSYAPDGGGVGPHFDSYDVFLLQGLGQRLWRISEQWDLSLIEDAPLRILKNFTTEQEWVLNAGDMLYLPPHIAHWGIAMGDCMTYSIGFRAPSTQELASEFLNFLQDRCQLQGRYADPQMKMQKHPAKISEAMVDQVEGMLGKLEWNKSIVAEFLGQYLTEPKTQVVFTPPRSLGLAAFTKLALIKGVALDLKSQMLFHNHDFYLNGEQTVVSKSIAIMMRKIADVRELQPEELTGVQTDTVIFAELMQLLHAWYQAGYLVLISRLK